jgi:PEP-CTERM motif
MSCILQKRMWLAGASLLAIVLGSGDANAVVFGTPGGAYTIPTTGWYEFRVAGAQGGSDGPFGRGAGALVGGELFLAAGETLDLIVGSGPNGIGGNGSGGGGGGGSFVDPGSLLFAAGGGAGSHFGSDRGNPGIGYGGHPSGSASYGGAGGSGIPAFYPGTYNGGGLPAQAGSFPNGGQGAQACFASGPCFSVAPNGGFGGGGGGGGGYDGGGGGGGAPGGYGGYGGHSYVIETARDPFGITGGNPGVNGYVSINFVAAPEPSTWAMMLLAFAGLGFMGWRSQRSRSPATI